MPAGANKVRCYVCCPPWGGWWDREMRRGCKTCGGTGWLFVGGGR